MGKSRVRTLLLAGLTIMLCAAMLVGGTFALWSKTVPVTNHLVAGKLDLKLERIALRKTSLNNETGYMDKDADVQTDEDDPVDLTKGSGVNVFGIEDGELVVPTSCYEATLKLTNNGSVAFKYDIIIELKTEHGTVAEITELAKQLKVSIDEDAGDDVGFVDKGYLSTFIRTESAESEAIVGGKVVISSYVAKGENASKSFKVRIEFANDADEGVTGIVNNDAMEQEASFDLIVEAVQLTSDPALNGD